MFRPRIIPVLLLKGKGLVKTTKYSNAKYIGDPINAVRIFNDLEADELVFLDITAVHENRTISVDLVKQLGDEAFMPFGVGGGIKNVRQAIDLINAGAEKVVLNTLFIEDPDMISHISRTLGNQSVVVSIDVKKNFFGKYRVYYKSGTKQTDMDPVTAAVNAEKLGAGEIILNYIPNDSLMAGYNLELIKMVSSKVNIPVVASCGAGLLKHFSEAYDAGAHAMAAGSMFVYHGARRGILINYPAKEEIINTFSKNE
ncbi:MAG: AglZ/HisF2 family acetamidino modification protein [Bacteroidales bacterium]|jgi:cyclase|nr:AglZ/HisF2 family acetamidino modification protein [Bacteroidales bacterium]